MGRSAKRIFCITESGPLTGVAEGGIHAIRCGDLAAVVRDAVSQGAPPTRQDLVEHLRVIEQVMARQTVVPVAFGTTAASEEEVRNSLLVPRYDWLRSLLDHLRGKVELGLKVMWRDLAPVLAEIVAEREDIGTLRAWIAARPGPSTYQQRVRIGQMVAEALDDRRARETDAIMATLAPLATETRAGKLLGDKMILNAAFLVEREREPEFDQGVARLGEDRGDRLVIRYVGPEPPFSFVDLNGIVSASRDTALPALR